MDFAGNVFHNPEVEMPTTCTSLMDGSYLG